MSDRHPARLTTSPARELDPTTKPAPRPVERGRADARQDVAALRSQALDRTPNRPNPTEAAGRRRR